MRFNTIGSDTVNIEYRKATLENLHEIMSLINSAIIKFPAVFILMFFLYSYTVTNSCGF